MKQRCDWANSFDLQIAYHDQEWGTPLHDDAKLFEFLILESMQAGLSWATILKRREAFRNAFDNFNYNIIANYNSPKLESLLKDSSIIHHKLKIQSVVSNTRAFLSVQEKYGSFNSFIWNFTNNKIIVNDWPTLDKIPSSTALSDKISTELKKEGFKFLGTVSVYAFLQAIGIVNDHVSYCFKTKQNKDFN